MFKKVLFFAGVSLLCAQAHAGLWDTISGWFGGGEKPSAEQTEQQASAAADEAANKTSDMVQKGIQLIPLLTSTLGVSDGQAKGGMGAILQAAQVLLSGSDYGTLLKGIPNAASLLDAAPKLTGATADKAGGLLDTAMQAAAEQSDTVKAGSQLLSQFKQLGLGADMIPKFTQTANQYLQQNDQTEAASLIETIKGL